MLKKGNKLGTNYTLTAMITMTTILFTDLTNMYQVVPIAGGF